MLLCVVWTAALGACSTEVLGGLGERESQLAVTVLAEEGIAARREATGEGAARSYAITVAPRESTRAAVALRSRGVPRKPQNGFEQLYESASMIPTPTEERVRFMSALSGQISSHLENLEGVLDASVIVTAPERASLLSPDAPVAPTTASVLLRIRDKVPGPPDSDVKRLVSGAVEGLTPQDVVVVVQRSKPVATASVALAPRWQDPLALMLVASLVVIIVMALWILVGSRRQTRLQPTETGTVS